MLPYAVLAFKKNIVALAVFWRLGYLYSTAMLSCNLALVNWQLWYAAF